MILEELKIEEWRRTAHGIITMCQISNSYVTPWIILDNGQEQLTFLPYIQIIYIYIRENFI